MMLERHRPFRSPFELDRGLHQRHNPTQGGGGGDSGGGAGGGTGAVSAGGVSTIQVPIEYQAPITSSVVCTTCVRPASEPIDPIGSIIEGPGGGTITGRPIRINPIARLGGGGDASRAVSPGIGFLYSPPIQWPDPWAGTGGTGTGGGGGVRDLRPGLPSGQAGGGNLGAFGEWLGSIINRLYKPKLRQPGQLASSLPLGRARAPAFAAREFPGRVTQPHVFGQPVLTELERRRQQKLYVTPARVRRR